MVSNAFPVSIKTKTVKRPGKQIYYPAVSRLASPIIHEKINEKIFRTVNTLMKMQYEEQAFDHFDDVIGLYEIKTNERDILSLSLTNYAISKHAAHGLTLMESLTFNVVTGKSYALAELFKPGSNYVHILSEIIKKQIRQREIPLLEPFTSIRPDQDFYLADKALVIYFQTYEITAGYYGFPMFPISVFDLEPIINPNGPLNILATNT